MPWRLHTGGRWRSWLGARFGGDAALGDRVWRRVLHGMGAGVLLYYVVPEGFFGGLPNRIVLLLALFTILLLELLRLATGLELPTIRPYEARRVASYTWYALALTVAVLLFPVAIAAVVVVGTAFVDPLVGELRTAGPKRRRWNPVLPLVLYAAMAFALLALVGHWPWVRTVAGALIAAVVAVAAERPKTAQFDDDLAMTLVPGAALIAVGWVGPGAPLSG